VIRNVKEIKAAVLLAAFFSAVVIASPSVSAQDLNFLDREISTVVDHVSDGVVTVEARQVSSRAPVYPGAGASYTESVNAVVGSGLLIDTLGHILTVLGLVDGYDRFRIGLGDRAVSAVLVGVDRRLNLAVLKIDSLFGTPLRPSSIPPLAGRLALAFGRALGGTGYPSLGIIAGRQNDGTFLMSGSAMPGLLGGGVFNLAGELIGIISSENVTVQNYTGTPWGGMILVPAEAAFAAVYKIVCCGNREAGYLGVETTAIELVTPAEKVLGEAVVISRIVMGSPAEKAGLRIGDIITGFSHSNVTSDREFQRLVNSAGADSTVLLDIMRGQQRFSLRIRLDILSATNTPASSTLATDARDRHSQLAIELQKRIDSMRIEMQRLQRELDRLLESGGSAR
jgi:serine protease Do